MFRNEDSMSRDVNALVAYKDSDDIAHYIMGLEADLRNLKVPKEKYKSILLRKLTTKARRAIRGYLDEYDCTYSDLKAILVKKLGMKQSEITDKLFNNFDRDTRHMDAVARVNLVRDLVERLSVTCKTMKDVLVAVAVGVFRTTLTPTELNILDTRTVVSLEDLGDVADTLKKPVISRSSYDRPRGRGEFGGVKCFKCHGFGHKASECKKADSSSSVCYSCHQPGHKSPDCPSRSEHSSQRDKGKVEEKPPKSNKQSSRSASGLLQSKGLCEVPGKVNGIPCKIVPDSGAEITMVARNLIRESDLLHETLQVCLASGKIEDRPLARVEFEIEGDVFSQDVVVGEEGARPDIVFFSVPLQQEETRRVLRAGVAAARSRVAVTRHPGDTPGSPQNDSDVQDEASLCVPQDVCGP